MFATTGTEKEAPPVVDDDDDGVDGADGDDDDGDDDGANAEPLSELRLLLPLVPLAGAGSEPEPIQALARDEGRGCCEEEEEEEEEEEGASLLSLRSFVEYCVPCLPAPL